MKSLNLNKGKSYVVSRNPLYFGKMIMECVVKRCIFLIMVMPTHFDVSFGFVFEIAHPAQTSEVTKLFYT